MNGPHDKHPPLPSSVPERARRLLRTWQTIRPHDLSSHQAFKEMVGRLIQEAPLQFDDTIRLAASHLKDLELQAGFRRDVMARVGHLEGLVDQGEMAVRSDAFVLPMAGDLAAMQALVDRPQAFLRLMEGLSLSGRFQPSDISVLEVPLKPEMANSSWLANALAHGVGIAMIEDPSPAESVSRPDEQALAQQLEPHRIFPHGHGVAVLAGVRVWFGPPEEAPDDGDLLVDPEQARARDHVETELAWQSIVLEVLTLAELPPGSITILPPATFLRGLAQVRALEQIHGLHDAMEANGTHDRFEQLATSAGDDGILRCMAMDSQGQVLAMGPEVNLAEIHAESQCYLATFAGEQGRRGPRTQQCLRRRGLH